MKKLTLREALEAVCKLAGQPTSILDDKKMWFKTSNGVTTIYKFKPYEASV
jgi:hypothetical protein